MVGGDVPMSSIDLETFRSNPTTVAVAFIKPIRKREKSLFSIFIAGEYYRENSNIDFLNNTVNAWQVGLMWKHLKK